MILLGNVGVKSENTNSSLKSLNEPIKLHIRITDLVNNVVV